jgi:DNA-binding CsgD family transcriptional regulator
VRKHIASAQERLGARTRTQVMAIVAANGLV